MEKGGTHATQSSSSTRKHNDGVECRPRVRERMPRRQLVLSQSSIFGVKSKNRVSGIQ